MAEGCDKRFHRQKRDMAVLGKFDELSAGQVEGFRTFILGVEEDGGNSNGLRCQGDAAQCIAQKIAAQSLAPWLRDTASRPIMDTGMLSGAFRRIFFEASARSTDPAEMDT